MARYIETNERTIGFEKGIDIDWIFHKAAELIAFDDLSDECVEYIEIDGERFEYDGWKPGMRIQFSNVKTGEVAYSRCFPEWDH